MRSASFRAYRIGAAIAITAYSVPAVAKFTAADAARIHGATILRIADATVTLDEFAQYPLPSAECVVWVQVALPDARLPRLLLQHDRRADGAMDVVAVAPAQYRAAFRDLATDFLASLPYHITTSSVTHDRGCDVRVSGVLVGKGAKPWAHEDFIRLIATEYARSGPPEIQYICTDIPTWIARAYPVVFRRVVPSEFRGKQVLAELDTDTSRLRLDRAQPRTSPRVP
ncbi:hypothetical protein HYV74_00630 [Candidatus Uhrbacteria bacterium]|nr:hypothetical protein [Candidatus Uhrbacteria bacterium]